MIRLVASTARSAGCERILAIVGHKAEEVAAVLPDFVECVHQPERIGTANAVAVAADALRDADGYLLVMCGDMPLLRPETLRQLIDVCQGRCMSVLTAHVENPSGYGRIVRDKTGTMCSIVEDKDASPSVLAINEVNTGIYCFALDGLFERLACIDNDNAQGEYYLTDMVKVCCAEGSKVTSLQLTDPEEAHGVNSRAQLADAAAILQRRVNARWMDEGVSIVAPALTWISPDCELEADVEILPNTVLARGTKVAHDCVIGPNTRLYGVRVGAGSVVEESIGYDSVMGERCVIGPRSYLRPGNVLDSEVKVGTSVEIKKSIIGRGSKVPHLSYMGDATIGEDVNVGAGTITCNYDGHKKSPTTIGDRVFVGSDTMLVAPVTLGEGSVTAAGSAITEDVPAGALAFGRARQVNKENYWAGKNVPKPKEGK